MKWLRDNAHYQKQKQKFNASTVKPFKYKRVKYQNINLKTQP